MESQSINDALLAYKSHLESVERLLKANVIYNQTKTAIVRHLIPGWDESLMPKSSRQLTNPERVRSQEFLEKAPVSKLSEALKVQEKVFEKYNVASSSRNVYKSRLETFIKWVRKQGWIQSKSGYCSSRCTPKMKYGHGHFQKKPLTNKLTKLSKYSLKTHSSWNTQRVEKLIEEVNQFYDCLVDEQYPGRLFESVKPSTASYYVRDMYLLFGWLANYRNIQPEHLSLNLLVPTRIEAFKNNLNLINFTDSEKEFIKTKNYLEDKIAQYVDTWICHFLKFLKKERYCQSAHTPRRFLVVINAIARYQYLGQAKDGKYKDIPAISVIDRHKKTCNKAIKNQPSVANIEMKWLDLDEIQKQIVEPLRLECEFRNIRHSIRSITAIVGSFMLFLIWGLSTYRPPRRQQELRGLKIALYCQIEDKPKNLAPNQLLHPRPCNRNTDKYHGYLYKAQDGNWYQDMTTESYKTGKTYKHQNLLIPNPKFPDGQCFYDYLEAYLYGYWRDRQGNWVSAGNTAEAPSVRHKLYALRMALNPKDEYNFVFLGKRSGKPFVQEDFGNLFKKSAHRLTGQLLTPHLLRDIYASWFLDREYTEDVIRSLAYAMGHSVEEMRKTYDQRKAQRKHEPIQKKLDETLSQLFGFNESKTMTNDAPPAGVDPALWAILSPEQKTMYQKLKRT